MDIGDRFGRWVLIANTFRENGATKVLAQCDCGVKKVVQTHHLRSSKSYSCGCFGRDKNRVHGMCETPLYYIWANMRQRCENFARDVSGNYARRGITVCDAWKSFKIFFDWAKEVGYQEGLTLDRIDNNTGYFPDNCRFTSYVVQSQNRRKQSNNTSGFIGVSCLSNGRYIARAKHNGVEKHIGTFDNLQKAAHARDTYVKKYYESPTLNFKERENP